MNMKEPTDAELEKLISEQRQLLQNLEKLEKGGPEKLPWSARMSRAIQSNKMGVAATLMASTCLMMSLSMLGNKKAYEHKSELLQAEMEEAHREKARAQIEAEKYRSHVEDLRQAILAEIKKGGWGMTQRLQLLASQDKPFSAESLGNQDAEPADGDAASKAYPKMI